MELGLFQLENLFLNPNRFIFFDLRVEEMRTIAVPHEVQVLLKRAETMAQDEVAGALKARALPPEFPVVLVCANGKCSRELADDLERAGYKNVYVVAGGVAGLLLEI